MVNKLNSYLAVLSKWFKHRNLYLIIDKSSTTLFTSWTKEVSLRCPITYYGQTISMLSNPRILGVVFDPLLTFNAHANQVRNRLKSRNNVLKCLAGSSWGKENSNLISSFKAISRPPVELCRSGLDTTIIQLPLD